MDQPNKQNQRGDDDFNDNTGVEGTWRRSGVQTQIWGDQVSVRRMARCLPVELS